MALIVGVGEVAWLRQIAVDGKRVPVDTSIAVLALVPFVGPRIARAKPRLRDSRTRRHVA